MDKFAERLRRDARAIDAQVSPELDARIAASLRAVTPEVAPPPAPRPVWPLWLGGTLATGVALIALVGVLQQPEAPEVAAPLTTDLDAPAPALDLDAEAAELVTPLSRELDNLQADLRKAEQILRDDLGL